MLNTSLTPVSTRGSKTALPPGPKGRPILGLLPEFRRDPAGFLLRTAREYGDIVFVRLGPQKLYLLNRPEHIQDILVTNQHKFTKSRMLQRSKMLLGEGLLTSEGEFHMRQRRLAAPAFHRQRLIGYSQWMTECAVHATEPWRTGETRNIAEEMMRLTLAIVGRTLFSTNVESDAAAIGEALNGVMALFNTLMLPWAEYLQKLP